MEAGCFPIYMQPFSAIPTGIQFSTFADGLASGIAGKLWVLTNNRLRVSTPGFSSGFNSINLSVFGYDRKTAAV